VSDDQAFIVERDNRCPLCNRVDCQDPRNCVTRYERDRVEGTSTIRGVMVGCGVAVVVLVVLSGLLAWWLS
jgi:hypothetical protein